jgi:hypothetical protein
LSRQTQYTIDLPLYIIYNKKGDKFYINLNQYRNTHFQTLNKVKILFEELVSPKLSVLPKIKKLNITYILFLGSKREVDLSNVCSISDKFFCDTLTNNKIIPDDNITIIEKIDYQWGGYDKLNPRVEAILNIIEFEEEEPMRVTLVQTEIEEALTNWVKSHMPSLNGNVKIELRAGRGEEGFTAEVNFILNQTNTNMSGITREITASTADSGKIIVSNESPFEPMKETPVAIENLAQELAHMVFEDVVTEDANLTATPVTEAPTGISTPKSLFGNLNVPKHDPQ